MKQANPGPGWPASFEARRLNHEVTKARRKSLEFGGGTFHPELQNLSSDNSCSCLRDFVVIRLVRRPVQRLGPFDGDLGEAERLAEVAAEDGGELFLGEAEARQRVGGGGGGGFGGVGGGGGGEGGVGAGP